MAATFPKIVLPLSLRGESSLPERRRDIGGEVGDRVSRVGG